MFNDDRIKQIAKNVKDFKAKYNEMKNQKKYNGAYLFELVQQYKEATKKDLQEYYNTKVDDLRKKQNDIQAKYEKQNSYDDPTKELLKRQDIERKVKLMSQEELKTEVDRFIKEGQAEPFYLDTLQLELKSNSLLEEFNKVKAYRNAYYIDEPWKADEEFINIAQEIMGINQVRYSDYIFIGEGEQKEVISYMEV